jgi:sulfur-oxidizing protein SoxZ
MTPGVKPHIQMPTRVAAGDVITIKVLAMHYMESGQRQDGAGNIVPRSILNRFTCAFNGARVVDIQLEPAIARNPYFQFSALVPEAGEFTFSWYGDDGSVIETTKHIQIT